MTDVADRSGQRVRGGGLLARGEQADLLGRLIGDPEARLVTVTGPAGVGKSALVAALATGPAAGGRPALVTAALAGLRDPGLATDAMVAAIGAGDPLISTPLQALWSAHGGRAVTLVLDGADGVVGLGGLIDDVLGGYPALTVVVTAERPLERADEKIVEVPPFPPAADDPDGPAVELFLDRAGSGPFSAEPGTSTRAAIAAVCDACGGLPRAIELAAARATTVPPERMAELLQGARPRAGVEGGRAGLADPADGLRAVMELTVSHLRPAARSAWLQASVFEGPFTVETAEGVIAPRAGATDLLDRFSELIDAHLLDLDLTDDEVRFALPSFARSWAARALAADGGADRARDAHAAFWARRCLRDADVAAESWPDLLAAVDWSVRNGSHDEALQMAAVAAVGAQGLRGAEESLVPLIEAALESDTLDLSLRARTLMWSTAHRGARAEALQGYGEWTAGRLARSVEIARASGDDTALLAALELVISSLGITFDIGGAVAAAHEGREVAARLGDEAAAARFDVWTAMALQVAGDLGGAARSLRSAYERGQRVGDDIAVVYSASMLRGFPAEEWGPIELPPLEELLARAEARRHGFMALHVLNAMVARDLAAGDMAGAIRTLARMLLVCETLHQVWPMAGGAPLIIMVGLLVRMGDLENAARLRASLRPLEPLFPGIVAPLVPAYAAACSEIEAKLPAERCAELDAEMAGSTLLDANRLAQGILRPVLARVAAAEPPAPARPHAESADPLTPRERDVLLQLATGATNRQAAEALGLAPKTVMHHTVAIYRKLGVQGRAEAVAWAYRSGLVQVP